MGMGSTMARVGSIVSPLVSMTAEIYPSVPLFIYGAVPVAASAIAALLPETLGQPLPDTVQDMESRWEQGLTPGHTARLGWYQRSNPGLLFQARASPVDWESSRFLGLLNPRSSGCVGSRDGSWAQLSRELPRSPQLLALAWTLHTQDTTLLPPTPPPPPGGEESQDGSSKISKSRWSHSRLQHERMDSEHQEGTSQSLKGSEGPTGPEPPTGGGEMATQESRLWCRKAPPRGLPP